MSCNGRPNLGAWWLSIEGFRSELNTRRCSPLQAIPSKPPLPLAQNAASRPPPSLSLPFPSWLPCRGSDKALGGLLKCQAVRFNRILVLWLSECLRATSPSGPFAEKCLSSFRPGQHQCHGGDVGQGNPSPPTCMRHSTQLTQPNGQPIGQSSCRAAVRPVLLPLASGCLRPRPELFPSCLRVQIALTFLPEM